MGIFTFKCPLTAGEPAAKVATIEVALDYLLGNGPTLTFDAAGTCDDRESGPEAKRADRDDGPGLFHQRYQFQFFHGVILIKDGVYPRRGKSRRSWGLCSGISPEIITKIERP